MAEITPTRGAALALADERRLVETGFGFLDEKRVLLAATLLDELAAWQIARDDLAAAMAHASDALKSAVGRHGLESVQLYPTLPGRFTHSEIIRRRFLGLGLLDEPETAWQQPAPPAAVDASAQAETARAAFGDLLPLIARLAVRRKNIHRLTAEYRKTERRARALENVILPETIATLKAITDYLDESDQEEAIRIRNAAR